MEGGGPWNDEWERKGEGGRGKKGEGKEMGERGQEKRENEEKRRNGQKVWAKGRTYLAMRLIYK